MMVPLFLSPTLFLSPSLFLLSASLQPSLFLSLPSSVLVLPLLPSSCPYEFSLSFTFFLTWSLLFCSVSLSASFCTFSFRPPRTC